MYKLVIRENGRCFSFYAKKNLRVEYQVDVPTKLPISCLYGFEYLEDVMYCIEMEENYLKDKDYRVFECDYKPSNSPYAFMWALNDLVESGTFQETIDYFKRELCYFGGTIGSFPTGTIACSEITLRKDITKFLNL